MRTRTAVLFFCLLFVITGTALATDGEWADAVDAAEAVDPTLTAPTVNSDVSIVGGGKVQSGGSFPKFAMSAFRRDGVVSGTITAVQGSGTILRADVVCIGSTASPDGGGVATLVGELPEPVFGNPTLVFAVSDSGLPGGDGDTWSGSLSPLPPSEFPCVPNSGSSTIADGNIAIRSLD